MSATQSTSMSILGSGTVFTTLHLRIRPMSWSVCHWQAFQAHFYVTFKLIGPNFLSYEENEVL
jgi:hypothetical protein